LVDRIFFQCATGKPVKAGRSPAASRMHGLHGEELAAEHADDDVELGVHVLGVGPGEDRAHRSGRRSR
jgi:hypothetical protein